MNLPNPVRRALARVVEFASRGHELVQSLSGRKSRRRVLELRLISNSRLFDADWYLESYPDVADAKIDPLRHYMDLGWRERRDPGPEFVTSAYLKANPDVAAAGVNPLLHFLEFGYFEGRGPAAHRLPPQRRTAVPANFGPAAQCISLPLPDNRPIRWKRSYRLDPDRNDLFSIEGCAVGYCGNPGARRLLETAFAALGHLSGEGRPKPEGKSFELPQGTERLLDAWYVNAYQLRTRWEGQPFPFVVRGFQHDPLAGGTLALVAEAIVESPLDLVDLHLKNRLFPVLFVFVEPEGAVSGARLLAFPSLCRDGLHFPELLRSAAAPGGCSEPLAMGEVLGARLLRLVEGAEEPAISRIEVEIRDADGRGLLFQADVQRWLQKVIRIAVEPAGPSDGSSEQRYLVEAVRGGEPRSEGRGVLIVGHDMLPTIGALTELCGPAEEAANEIPLPLIIATAEPNQPKIAVELPRAFLPAVPEGSSWISAWPRLARSSSRALPSTTESAAIALPSRKALSDAEILIPRPRSLPEDIDRPAISWVVETEGWSKEGLAQAVHALSLQFGGSADCLTFVGTSNPLSSSIAGELFGGRVNTAANLKGAIAAADTPLIGFIGAGIVLHDNWSATELASLLAEETIATASCLIVEASQAAIGDFPVAIADDGAVGTILMTSGGGKHHRSAIAHLWGTSYPVAVPITQVWLARRASLNEWMKAPRCAVLGNAFHICSSLTTATQLPAQSRGELPPFLPRAPDSRVTRVEALFG